jgi:hypothetical protein
VKRILVLVVTATVAVGGAAHAVVVGAAASEEPAAESPLAAARPCLMSISVANLDVSARWYGDVLGFREIRRLAVPASSLVADDRRSTSLWVGWIVGWRFGLLARRSLGRAQ